MKLRSFALVPGLIPVVSSFAASGPPPDFVGNHPGMTTWLFGVLVSALSLSVLIHGFFLARTIRQIEENNKDRKKEIQQLIGMYGAIEHRQTVVETSISGCCGLPGGRRDYDPTYVVRSRPNG